MIALLALFLVPRIAHGRMTPLLASHVIFVTIGYVMMFIIGGLAICYVFADWFHRTGPSQRCALRRTILQLTPISAVLTTIGIILGMIWAKENWGRYWAWDPKETGAAIVFLCALVTFAFAALKPANYRLLVSAAIIGNIGTAWGWFGANGAGVTPLLAVFIASQCVILLAFSATSLKRYQDSAVR